MGMKKNSTDFAKARKGQGGQLVVEAVLLMVVGMIITMMVTESLREKQFAQTLIAKPWSTLSGMIECGVWSGCAADKHPASRNRHASAKPDL
jgi:hypothetical protein